MDEVEVACWAVEGTDGEMFEKFKIGEEQYESTYGEGFK